MWSIIKMRNSCVGVLLDTDMMSSTKPYYVGPTIYVSRGVLHIHPHKKKLIKMNKFPLTNLN